MQGTSPPLEGQTTASHYSPPWGILGIACAYSGSVTQTQQNVSQTCKERRPSGHQDGGKLKPVEVIVSRLLLSLLLDPSSKVFLELHMHSAIPGLSPLKERKRRVPKKTKISTSHELSSLPASIGVDSRWRLRGWMSTQKTISITVQILQMSMQSLKVSCTGYMDHPHPHAI